MTVAGQFFHSLSVTVLNSRRSLRDRSFCGSTCPQVDDAPADTSFESGSFESGSFESGSFESGTNLVTNVRARRARRLSINHSFSVAVPLAILCNMNRATRTKAGSDSPATAAHCRLFSRTAFWLAIVLSASCQTPLRAQQQVDFETQELAVQLTVGYAVRTIDMNSDGQLDIAIVDSKRILWLENPTWSEHVIYATPDARFDNVCFAPHDVNGDGRVDLALGADWQFGNSDSGGTIGWLEHPESGPWTYRQIASEPTTHRMNWVDIQGNGRPTLVVAPLKGRGTRGPGFDQVGIRLLGFQPGASPAVETWDQRVITDQLHVMHNFDVTDLDDDGHLDLVTASYEGASWLRFNADGSVKDLRRLGAGQEQPAPKRGASEIRRGKLGDGRNYLATVEPWHGDKIVVYVQPDNWLESNQLWQRFVIDDQLVWGHAVACANLDDDPDEELVIGVRDNQNDQHRCGLRIYDPQDAVQGQWQRQIVDPGGVAIEDLTVADLDGDGDNDIVAVGRATHNAKIYWNR